MEQVSVQAFNDEDPRGRRTLGNHHSSFINFSDYHNYVDFCCKRMIVRVSLLLPAAHNCVTLRVAGLFLHRRKAEDVGPHRKVSFRECEVKKFSALLI